MSEMSEQAKAAAAIRKELKEAFPDVKFSVRSSSFAGGDDVHIEWVDGPTYPQVEEITRKYQYGHFDGMVDMYEYSNRRDDIPQSKYVQTSRKYSNKRYAEAVSTVNKQFGYELKLTPINEYGKVYIDPKSDAHTGHGWQSQEVHKWLQERSF